LNCVHRHFSCLSNFSVWSLSCIHHGLLFKIPLAIAGY
jgi:hypothetical protein